MKIVCSNTALSNGVQVVLKAVPTNTTMNILECILLDTTGGTIKLTSNDTDLGIETIIEGTILEPGRICVVAKKFAELVRKLPNGDITLEVKDNCKGFVHYYGNSKQSIECKSGEEFITLPVIETTSEISLLQYTLKDMIRQTIFSIGVGDTNKIMSGIHMVIKNDVLTFTSLDGHRISIRKVKMNNIYSEREVIIPGKALTEISKILSGGAEDQVTMYLSDNHILFEFDQTKVITRLIDGKYFDVSKMMSSEYQTKIHMNKNRLYETIDRSMLYSREGNKKPIVLNITDSNLNIKVNDNIDGLDENIEIEKQGGDIRIGFNPKFLIDAIKVIDEDEIDIYFMNSKAPCYIKDEHESYLYMILPVNLND